MTQCLQSTLRPPRWKVFYNSLLVCPACVNQEVQEASDAGPGGGFSQPQLLRGARIACSGMLGCETMCTHRWEPRSNINQAVGCWHTCTGPPCWKILLPPQINRTRPLGDSWAWCETLQMRFWVAFGDLSHPASEPSAHSSPGYFSQAYTVFPKTAEESSVGFNRRNTRIFPLLREFYFSVSGEQRDTRQ